uniref:Putative secreted protein n=1 Tax=Amblyomma cajennense TaxID=34607 RepID=A0A023FD45_AMBCJ
MLAFLLAMSIILCSLEIKVFSQVRNGNRLDSTNILIASCMSFLLSLEIGLSLAGYRLGSPNTCIASRMSLIFCSLEIKMLS